MQVLLEFTTVYFEGIFLLNTSINTTIGQSLYFHDSNGKIDADSGNSGVFLGFSLENKSAGQTKIMLNKSIVSSQSVDLSGYLKIADLKTNLINAAKDTDVKKAFTG